MVLPAGRMADRLAANQGYDEAHDGKRTGARWLHREPMFGCGKTRSAQASYLASPKVSQGVTNTGARESDRR